MLIIQGPRLNLAFIDRMPFDDFLLHFTEMSICRLINTSVFSLSKTWKETMLFGSWRLGESTSSRAGGCLNHPDTFLNNPQACKLHTSVFCALFRKLRSKINSKFFLKTQHFGGMTKIFCYFSWVLLRKAWKNSIFPQKTKKFCSKTQPIGGRCLL